MSTSIKTLSGALLIKSGNIRTSKNMQIVSDTKPIILLDFRIRIKKNSINNYLIIILNTFVKIGPNFGNFQ